MISFIKNFHAVQQESQKLITLVHTGLPVDSEYRIRARQFSNKTAITVRQVAGSACAFACEHNTGIFSRSYLANRVRWGLLDLGYSEEFVDSITASIVIAMQQARE